MGFGSRMQQPTETNRVEVDWNALNEHVITTAGTAAKKKSLVGIISGLYDLGLQKIPDAEMEFKGTEEDERKAIAEHPQTYFVTKPNDKGVDTRYKCWPQKDQMGVAIAVDFPTVMVNKGQFFGDENAEAKPLRLILNGEFQLGGERVLGRVYDLKLNKKLGFWSLAQNSTLYKLATATGVIGDGEALLPQQLPELLGKAALFEMRVWMKPDKKDKSKAYFSEYVKLAGMIPEGMESMIPEFDSSILHKVEFDEENKEEDVKQLRLSVRNTMKRSSEYEDSKLKVQIDKLFPAYNGGNAEQNKQDNSGSPDDNDTSGESDFDPDNFDDDAPF